MDGQKRPDSIDPLMAEFARLWRAIRLLIIATLALFLAVGIAAAFALAIRANDIEAQTRQNSVEAVAACFRQSAQRPELLDITLDPTLSLSVRGFVRGLYENTPSRQECFDLAEALNTPPPTLPPPETIR